MRDEKFLISAHADKEIESPWREVLDQKIQNYSKWKEEYELHLKLKSILAAQEDPKDLKEAQKRVLLRLETFAELKKTRKTLAQQTRNYLPRLAAAAVFAVVCGGLGFLWGHNNSYSNGTEVAEIKVQMPVHYDFQFHGDGKLVKMTSYEGLGSK